METIANIARDLWDSSAFRIGAFLVIVASAPVYFLSCAVEIVNR